jgi:DNA-binding XRE family transcriptional regulator
VTLAGVPRVEAAKRQNTTKREVTTTMDKPLLPDVEPMRIWRMRRAMTQADLAAAAGVSRQTVSNIERQFVTPMPLVREAIADALEVPAEFITELRNGAGPK